MASKHTLWHRGKGAGGMIPGKSTEEGKTRSRHKMLGMWYRPNGHKRASKQTRNQREKDVTRRKDTQKQQKLGCIDEREIYGGGVTWEGEVMNQFGGWEFWSKCFQNGGKEKGHLG